jgi:ABC-2 type transport system ATP-binding protein
MHRHVTTRARDLAHQSAPQTSTRSTPEPNQPKPAAIEAEGLEKVYADGTRALGGISFAVAPGEIFGLLGPNGSGKTTTVRIFVTLLRRSSGAARIAGYDVDCERRRVRQLIGYSGQYAGVDQDLTVTENLVQSGRLHGLTLQQTRGRADELIDVLGLAGAANQRAGRLSGGMRRRLDLAQAMVHRPAALFLDEPTTGLDPQARNALWDYLQTLSAQGTAILLTTQYLEEADRLCQRVAIVDRGTLLAVGNPASLKDAAGEDRITLTLEDPTDTQRVTLAQRIASEQPGVRNVVADDQSITVQARAAGTTLPELIVQLANAGVRLARLQLVPTSLDDVFIAYTGDTPRSDTEAQRRPTSVFAALHGGGTR